MTSNSSTILLKLICCFLLTQKVSWIRRRDSHILSVDRTMFIPDERFQALFVDASDTWTLQVKYVQARDEGEYECQISTDPKKSHIIKLNIVGEIAKKISSMILVNDEVKSWMDNLIFLDCLQYLYRYPCDLLEIDHWPSSFNSTQVLFLRQVRGALSSIVRALREPCSNDVIKNYTSVKYRHFLFHVTLVPVSVKV